MKIILKNHSTTDSVVGGFFGFELGFAQNPIFFIDFSF
jgi:hypothetical protein